MCAQTLGGLGGLCCVRPAGHAPGCSFESSWAADGIHDDVTDED